MPGMAACHADAAALPAYNSETVAREKLRAVKAGFWRIMTCSSPLTRLAHTLGTALALALGTGAAQAVPAQAGPLATFLGALDGSPELLAAQAALEAAELQLRAARDPVALEATGGYSGVALDDRLPGAGLCADLCAVQTPPDSGGASAPTESGFQVATTLTFRPYPFGNLADLVAQRELDYELRVLELESTRAGLEARALEAALQARLAERSAALAREGVTAAAQGLHATRLRAAKNAANDRELRGAQFALFEAETVLQNARLDVGTAHLNLHSLVGDTPPPSYEALVGLAAPSPRTPLSVEQTLLQTRQAALGISAARRELLPVASASYAWNVSDYSTVTAAVESRTLQPSVGFSYQEPGRTLPASAVDGTLQLGISANISVGALDALGAAERQETAAEAGLMAAREGGALQENALRGGYTKAARDAELGRRSFENARLTYRENVTRQELGLSSPLETQTALLELLQADLERSRGELAALSALLDLYELYALSPSETLPLKTPPLETPR